MWIFVLLMLRGLVAPFLKKKFDQPNIIVVGIDGVLANGGKAGEWFQQVIGHLKQVALKKPLGLILRVNSPGGTVGASQALYSRINDLRKKGIKVVAHMEDVAASGGLFACMAADKIVAEPGTMTGSIGVIIRGWEYSKILDNIGLRVHTIKSGRFKDTMSPTREMTDEERHLLEGLVVDVHDQFCDTIATARNLTRGEVDRFADGRILTGRQAQALGLVDGLGSFQDAVALVRNLVEIPDGRERIEYMEAKKTLFQRMGFSSFRQEVRSLLQDSLPDRSLSGIPLWLMPRM